MSIVIDANRAADFSSPVKANAADIAVRIKNQRIKVVVGGRLRRELLCTKLGALLNEWKKSGRVIDVSDHIVNETEIQISSLPLKSNDPHIIALCIVSGNELVYTNDGDLISDLKNTSLISPKREIIKHDTKSHVVASLLQRHRD